MSDLQTTFDLCKEKSKRFNELYEKLPEDLKRNILVIWDIAGQDLKTMTDIMSVLIYSRESKKDWKKS